MKPITIKIVDDSLLRRLSMRKLLKQRCKLEDEISNSNNKFLITRLELELKDVEDEMNRLPKAEFKDVLNQRQSYLRAESIGLKKAIEQRITNLIMDVEDYTYLTPAEEVRKVNELINKCEGQILNKYFRQMILNNEKNKKIPPIELQWEIDKRIIKNAPEFNSAIITKEGNEYKKFLDNNKIVGSPHAIWILRLLEIAKEMGLVRGKTVDKETRIEICKKLKNEKVKKTNGKEVTTNDIKRQLINYGFSDPNKNKKREPDPREAIYQFSD